ncbi:(ribosomal protein S18)-alanine N-acetyltransferase [Gammaproteobacteria bacterium]
MTYASLGGSSTAFLPMAKTFETFEEAMAWREPIPIPSRRAGLIPSQLRPMRTADLEAIMVIERQAYEFPWTIGMFEDCLQVGYCCWICEDRQSLYGYGVMSVGAGECHILNLCISPELQGRGLGRYLMTHLLHLGRRHHADTAFLEVRSSNQAALGLYLSMGFNEIGLRRAYYPSRRGREDALMLARSL